MAPMPQGIPVTLVFVFYGLVAWGLMGLFVAFRLLAGPDLMKGISFRLGLLLWLGIPAWLATKGVLLDFSSVPPQLMRVVIPMGILVLGFGLSPWARTVARALPVTLLVGIQAFRLPLEIVLYYLGEYGMLSREMTLAGYNFDIVTGAFALGLWLWLHSKAAVPSWALWAFNALGTLLLVVVVTIAILGFPAPFGWFQPPNLIIVFFPWTWLPTFLVPLALVSHLLLFRKLMEPADEPRTDMEVETQPTA